MSLDCMLIRNLCHDSIRAIKQGYPALAEECVQAILKELRRNAADVRDPAWIWSVPVDDKDTVRGSTEDGWAASVQPVGEGWHVTITLNTKVGDAVFGNRCSTREHGVLIAQTKRIERLPNVKGS